MSVKQGTIIYHIEREYDNKATPYIVVGENNYYIFAIRIVNHGYNCNSHIWVKQEWIKDKCFEEFSTDFDDEFNDIANDFVDLGERKIKKYIKENY